MTEFCVVEFKYGGGVFYAIWCTDEDDYFFMQDDALVCFSARENAEKYCAVKSSSEPAFASFDFDSIDHKNCDDYLKKWNIIDDLARTLKTGFLGNEDSCSDLYAKFVYGANIPALNTSGKKYRPAFGKAERHLIARVSKDMIRILRLAFTGRSARENPGSKV